MKKKTEQDEGVQIIPYTCQLCVKRANSTLSIISYPCWLARARVGRRNKFNTCPLLQQHHLIIAMICFSKACVCVFLCVYVVRFESRRFKYCHSNHANNKKNLLPNRRKTTKHNRITDGHVLSAVATGGFELWPIFACELYAKRTHTKYCNIMHSVVPSKNVWKKRTNIKIGNANKRKSCTQIKRSFY